MALANNPDIRAVIQYDKRNTYGAALGLWHIIKEVRDRRTYDAAYLAQGSLRSGLLAMVTGAKQRIGFASSTGRVLYTHQVQYRPDQHHAQRLSPMTMSECADPPTPEPILPRLYPSDPDLDAVDRLMPKINSISQPIVALAPGSAL